MRTTINDSRITSLSYEQAEMSLALIQGEENNWFEKWADLLGLVWRREDLLQSISKNKDITVDAAPPQKLFYPLSLLVNPDLFQSLKKVFELEAPGETKEGMSHVPAGAIPMTVLSKDEFIRRMGMGGQRQGDNFDMFGPQGKPSAGLQPGPERRLGDR